MKWHSHQSKLAMQEEIAEIVYHLHQGDRSVTDLLIEDLKARAVHMDSQIQQDVLIFAAQVQFQYDYDPWHKVTPEVQNAADQLLKDLNLSY